MVAMLWKDTGVTSFRGRRGEEGFKGVKEGGWFTGRFCITYRDPFRGVGVRSGHCEGELEP